MQKEYFTFSGVCSLSEDFSEEEAELYNAVNLYYQTDLVSPFEGAVPLSPAGRQKANQAEEGALFL